MEIKSFTFCFCLKRSFDESCKYLTRVRYTNVKHFTKEVSIKDLTQFAANFDLQSAQTTASILFAQWKYNLLQNARKWKSVTLYKINTHAINVKESNLIKLWFQNFYLISYIMEFPLVQTKCQYQHSCCLRPECYAKRLCWKKRQFSCSILNSQNILKTYHMLILILAVVI